MPNDNRLTVVQVTLSANRKDTMVEAIATSSKTGRTTKRLRFRLKGICDVDFGWLIGHVSGMAVELQWHPDEPGLQAFLVLPIAELQPLQ